MTTLDWTYHSPRENLLNLNMEKYKRKFIVLNKVLVLYKWNIKESFSILSPWFKRIITINNHHLRVSKVYYMVSPKQCSEGWFLLNEQHRLFQDTFWWLLINGQCDCAIFSSRKITRSFCFMLRWTLFHFFSICNVGNYSRTKRPLNIFVSASTAFQRTLLTRDCPWSSLDWNVKVSFLKQNDLE